MKKLLPAKLTGLLLVLGFLALIVFHVLVLVGVVSPGVVWGGMAVGDPANLVLLESLAIVVSLAFIGVVLAKAGFVNSGRAGLVATVGTWLLFGFLVLNALGNLASGVSVENWLFAPLAIVMALLALRLALE